MQREHVVVLTCQDFIAGLDDQFISGVVQPSARTVGGRGALLQDRIARDHFAGDQIRADGKMLKRTLGLSAPELVGRHFDDAEAVRLFSHLGHGYFPFFCELSPKVQPKRRIALSSALRVPSRCLSFHDNELGSAHSTLITTSILPRVALEYGQILCASSTRA